jgi:MFS transporter, DHA1 family, tetracycline resistance protein
MPILFVFVVVDLLGFSLILPLLPYYARVFSASPLLIGLLGTANALAQMVAAPVIGRLSDRFGRRPMLLLGTFAGFACFLMLGLAQSMTLLFVSRVLNGLLGGNISLAQAYITDVSDEKNRARQLGMIGAAFGIGFIVGPALGGLLSTWGQGIPAFAASGLSLLNFLWILAALPESLTAERRAALAMKPRVKVSLGALAAALRKPKVGPILTTQLLYFVAFGLLTANFALYALERLGLQVQATGYILAYVGVLSVLVQGFGVGLLTKRFAEQKLAVTAIGILTITLLAWGLVPNVPLLLVVFAPMALSAGLLGTLMSSLLTKSVARDEVGGTLGLSSSLQSLSQVVAPVVGGFLLGQLGAWSLGLLAAALMALAFVFAWRRLLPSAASAQGA